MLGVHEDQETAPDADSVFDQGHGPVRRFECADQAGAEAMAEEGSEECADNSEDQRDGYRLVVREREGDRGHCAEHGTTYKPWGTQAAWRIGQLIHYEFAKCEQDNYDVRCKGPEKRERRAREREVLMMQCNCENCERSERAQTAEHAETQNEQEKCAGCHA